MYKRREGGGTMEHINPVIVIALIVQAFISNASRRAGAMVGYLITSGILIWGLGLYSEGDAIALFGIPLTQPIFLMACLIWYGFDTHEFLHFRGVSLVLRRS